MFVGLTAVKQLVLSVQDNKTVDSLLTVERIKKLLSGAANGPTVKLWPRR